MKTFKVHGYGDSKLMTKSHFPNSKRAKSGNIANDARKKIRVVVKEENSKNFSRNGSGNSVGDAFRLCKKSASDLNDINAANDQKLLTVLKNILVFYKSTQKNEFTKLLFRMMLRRSGIKVTDSTKNPILPAIKAILGKINKSNQGRYAAAIYLAYVDDVDPKDFEESVRMEGGLVPYAKEGALLLRSKEGRSKTKKSENKLINLRQNARHLDKLNYLQNLPDGLSSILVEKEPDGRIKLLALKREDVSALGRFAALEPLDSPKKKPQKKS